MLKLNKVSLATAAAFFMVMGGVANAGDSTSFGNVNANLAASSAKADSNKVLAQAAQARADAAYALGSGASGKTAAPTGPIFVAAKRLAPGRYSCLLGSDQTNILILMALS